ncbi:MAG TPA: 16S rRNA (guanine(527)-N(7))-methyltransferase RsmG [Alphaproteobacteria bacterium]
MSVAAPLDAEGFARLTGVSRETLANLETYAGLLARWQRRINLVGRSTLADLWRRHMLDSAQLAPLVPAQARTMCDIGAGAGFPGLVLAIVLAERLAEVSLIEADARKGAFLGEVIRATGAPARVVTARAEQCPIAPVEVVVARACAPLDRLLGYAAPLLLPGGIALLLKGREVDRELTEARNHWTMTVVRHPSRTHPGGTILEVRTLARVDRR